MSILMSVSVFAEKTLIENAPPPRAYGAGDIVGCEAGDIEVHALYILTC